MKKARSQFAPQIPKQRLGSKLDVKSSVTFNSLAEAIVFYAEVKQRLLNVNKWAEICELPGAAFAIMDQHNQHIDRRVEEGDYLRIDIPGPGTRNGRGFDWVKVERIAESGTINGEALSIRVRPTGHPLAQRRGVAHFFSSSATSNFEVKRDRYTVLAEVHGRNEQPNNRKGFLIDRVRNTLVGVAAKFGFSFPQWKLLVVSLLKR